MTRVPLAIAVGDPGGVGPEVAVEALVSVLGDDRAVVFGDADRLERRIANRLPTVRMHSGAESLDAGSLGLVHVDAWSEAVVNTHAPNVDSGAVQLRMLERASDSVAAGETRVLVTGPVSKEAIAMGGVTFSGQTEFLAERSGLARDAVTMMFLGERLRIALATTHFPIAKVSEAITEKRVRRAIVHLAEALVSLGYGEEVPATIEVTGLNPHAGESGLLGHEDDEVIAPVVEALKRDATFDNSKVRLLGPTPAEAVLRYAAAGKIDGVVAMYHDQATIASKILDWGNAVNVTWGLPFIRTSVDHGVAYDAAENGKADADGMRAAIALAQRFTV